MTDKTRHKGRLLKVFSVTLLFIGLISLPGWLTKAESDTNEKKVTLKDAIVREAHNRIRAKRGFTLVREGDSTVQVFKKNVLVGKVKCGVCAHEDCKATVSGPTATCSGCGSDTGKDCTIDVPF